MSPDQNNPQSSPDSIKDLINKTVHPEGARTFTAGLPEVAPHLVTPETPEAIDPVTGNVSFDRLDPSLVEQATEPEITLPVDTQTQPDRTELTPDGQGKPEASPRRWSKKIRVAAGAAVGAVVLGGGGFATYKAMNDAPSDRDSTTVSSPANTDSGEIAPAPEINGTGSGIVLTPEQAEAFLSGDLLAVGKVFDETMKPQIETSINAFMSGEASSINLSSLENDPMISRVIEQSLLNNFLAYEGADLTVAPGVYACPANAVDPELVGSGCEDRMSTVAPGEPLILAIERRTMDDPLASRLENRQTITYPEIVPELIDGHLVLTTTASE